MKRNLPCLRYSTYRTTLHQIPQTSVNHRANAALFFDGHVPSRSPDIVSKTILEAAATTAGDIHAQFQIRYLRQRYKLFTYSLLRR